MAYALQADIEARYPGELAQAGPRESDGDLDTAAIALACAGASELVDRYLRALGWTTPLDPPVPAWVTDLTVDLALYRATPTAVASQADFSDRKARADLAMMQLTAMVGGRLQPPAPDDGGSPVNVMVTANDRQFGIGTL
jgi:phage gp36-like protein